MLSPHGSGAVAGGRRRNKKKGKNRATSGGELNQLTAATTSTSPSTPIAAAGPSTSTSTSIPASNLIPKGPRYPNVVHTYSRAAHILRGSNVFSGPLTSPFTAATPTTPSVPPVSITQRPKLTLTPRSSGLNPVSRLEENIHRFWQISDSGAAAAAETISAGQERAHTWEALFRKPSSPVPQIPQKPQPRSSSPDPYALAEEASVLLEVFSQSINEDATSADNTQNQDLIKGALDNVSKIWGTLWGRDANSSAHPSHDDRDPTLMVYSGCVICYSAVAETVLLPCKHLVLCLECCDDIGIKDKETVFRDWRTEEEMVKCPLCRVAVSHRIKIFRG